MKKTNFLTLLFVILSIQANAQQSQKEKNQTKADEFSEKSGTLMERQFIEVGKLKGVEIKILKVKDLVNNTGYSALRFEYEYKSSYSSDTKISAIDQDEIDGLVKSINALKTNVLNTTRDNYTEVTFKSRTGLEAGAYYSSDKQKWTGYLQIEKYDRNSMVFFASEDFDQLLEIIEKAKTMM
jgi:hypothetical protein